MKSRFEEFIEIDKFRKALGYVSRATGMAFSVLDPLGNVIIYPMNESDFCKEARKDSKVTAQCVDCIVHSAIAAAKSKRTHFFKCQYGLLEFVVPIFINGEYVSAVCGGEVRTDIDDAVDYTSIRKKNSTRNCKSCSTISEWWRKTAIMPLRNSSK